MIVFSPMSSFRPSSSAALNIVFAHELSGTLASGRRRVVRQPMALPAAYPTGSCAELALRNPARRETRFLADSACAEMPRCSGAAGAFGSGFDAATFFGPT